jgi:hypothetical protein
MSEGEGSDEVGEPDAEDEPTPDQGRRAYAHDPTTLAVATAIVDEGFAEATDGWGVGIAIRAAGGGRGLPEDHPLLEVLSMAAGYSLHVHGLGEPARCELGSDGSGDSGWPPPIDKVSEDIVALWRDMATSASEPAAIARFNDLLFCRHDGNGRDRASAACEAYLDFEARRELDHDGVEALMRGWSLARQVGIDIVVSRARVRMAHHVGDLLTHAPGDHAGIVLPLLGALAAGPARRRRRSAVVAGDSVPDGGDPVNVDSLLDRAQKSFRRGFHATEIAHLRRSRTRDPVVLDRIARDEVETYLEEADTKSVATGRQHFLEEAARIAGDRGLPDLRRRAAAALESIDPADLGLQHITASVALPPDIAEGFLAPFVRSPDWRDGILHFLNSDPPTGSLAQLKEQAEESHDRSLVARMFSTTVLGAFGLPRVTTSGDKDKLEHQMSFVARTTAEFMGGVLATGLGRLADEYGIPSEADLTELLTRSGSSDERLARMLSRAFRHFWAEDWISCVYLATPLVEAAARDLLREIDEGLYQVQVGKDPGQYPGLFVLLEELERVALDESWAYFLRWLLLGPWGLNLRNEIAHGFVKEVGPTHAALVLRAASLLVWVAGPTRRESTQPVTEGERTRVQRSREHVLRLLASPTGSRPGTNDSEERGWIERTVSRVRREARTWRKRQERRTHPDSAPPSGGKNR